METTSGIKLYEKNGKVDLDMHEADDSDFEMDDQSTYDFVVGQGMKIDLANMDYSSWSNFIQKDAGKLEQVILMVVDIMFARMPSSSSFTGYLIEGLMPYQIGQQKVPIFTMFFDTSEYL